MSDPVPIEPVSSAEPPRIAAAGESASALASPGPIYLQGSEKGHVAFRNIAITPAK